jgi:hypothetical protein
MSNIYGRQFSLTKEAKLVTIFARVTFGAVGAPTLVTAQSKGVKSVVRNSAGAYTFTFGNTTNIDTYMKLLDMGYTFDEQANAGTAPVAPLMYILTNLVATAGTLKVVFNSTAQSATDPASTEAVLLHFSFSNSTAF